MIAATQAFQCRLCGGARASRLFEAPDRLGIARQTFEVRRCDECGLAATWPPATEAELAAYYPDEYWAESTEPTQIWIERTQREKTRALERHLASGRVLDVGCGAGFFLRALAPAAWERYGVEISPRSAAVADRHLGGGRVFPGGLAGAPFEKQSFDAVTFWASLEHVVAPRDDLESARALLRPDGLLIVQVPDFGSRQARHFGADWFALDLPRHRHHFDRDALGRLLGETGFDVVETITRSETHDRHALKQSLKTRWVGRVPLGRTRYYATARFLGIVERFVGGATLTLAARASG